MKTKNGRVMAILVLVLFAVTSFAARPAQAANFQIVSPNDISYANWGDAWWKWLFSIPVSQSPALDKTGAKCDSGQSGPVWFLVGTFALETDLNTGAITGQATRSCTIPAGKMIFFPVIDSECSEAEGNGTTYGQLLSCTLGFDKTATNLEVVVDGNLIANLAAGDPTYRAHSTDLATYSLPKKNILGLPAGTTSHFVSDGWWLMLAPLPAGNHVIHFHGEVTAFQFTLDITYNLTVLAQ